MAVSRSRKPPPAKVAPPQVTDHKVNAQITARTVRLVHEDGHEIVRLEVAAQRAKELGLDLVQITSSGDVPVCKLMDFKAFKEQGQKRSVEKGEQMRLAAKSALVKTKEIRVGCSILDHDLNTKLKKVNEFLQEGKRVTISCTYEVRRGLWKQEYPKAIEVAKRVWQMYNKEYTTWFDYGASGNKQVSIVVGTSAAGRLSEPFPWEAGSKPPPFLLKMQEEAAAAKAAGLESAPGRAQGGRGGGNRRHS